MFSADPTTLILLVLVAVVNLLILWAIIRSAVRAALRDHQEWLDKRANPDLGKPQKLS